MDQPTAANPLNNRDNSGGPALRHESLNSLFQVKHRSLNSLFQVKHLFDAAMAELAASAALAPAGRKGGSAVGGDDVFEVAAFAEECSSEGVSDDLSGSASGYPIHRDLAAVSVADRGLYHVGTDLAPPLHALTSRVPRAGLVAVL